MRSVAYSPAFKVLATLIVFGAAGWLLLLWQGGKLGTRSSLAAWFLAGLAMMFYTWWCIVRSVTTLDGEQLRQTWVWTKKMDLRELAYGRLIRVRGLEWLIAPRLYVRTLLGKFQVFYAAEPEMVAEFERLVAELAAFRSTR
ncbi:MAG: hypothetical protein JWQ76_1449 [Ramlibacter sp.]|nr:hypothetical protein [Ramlibacter sp.]